MSLTINKNLKSILEVQLSASDANYAIGDIHGCLDALLELEAKIQASAKRRKLQSYKIFSIGDLCDRGPNTAGVLAHFADGYARGTHKLILGNHESFFMLALMGLRPDLLARANVSFAWFHQVMSLMFSRVMTHTNHWRSNGGAKVFESYNADIDNLNTWDHIPDAAMRLMFEAPLVIHSDQFVLSHALLHPGDLELFAAKDRGEEVNEDALEKALMRCLWEREFSESAIASGKKHISGHTPVESVVRKSNLAAIQIDTGAVYGNTLTAIDLGNFRTLSVASRYSCKFSSDHT